MNFAGERCDPTTTNGSLFLCSSVDASVSGVASNHLARSWSKDCLTLGHPPLEVASENVLAGENFVVIAIWELMAVDIDTTGSRNSLSFHQVQLLLHIYIKDISNSTKAALKRRLALALPYSEQYHPSISTTKYSLTICIHCQDAQS